MAQENFDAIIVGGGFGGVYHLIHLRELGLKCKLIEAEPELGGTWYWNTYPGARADSDIPTYEYSRPDLWEDWTWSEKFPGCKEIKAITLTSAWPSITYFDHVDKKLDVSKDCRFNTRVKQAHWDNESHMWRVTSEGKDGTYKATSRYLIMCMGFASKPFTPKIKGLETFEGTWSHTARWPKEGIDTAGKRVGVIGTGASGVQVIQATGRQVKHLTVFQRTPNFATPMGQYRVTKQVQDHFKPVYEGIFKKRPNTFCGYMYDWIPRPMKADSEEEREATFQALWDRGGFHFWMANYQDLLVDKDTNDAAYAFWRKQVLPRIKDPKKRDLLAPEVSPHPFGCKRPCLEQCFYEVLCQDNVDIVDIKKDPILEVTPKGVKTAEGEHELDVLVLATGFDNHVGALVDINIRGINGQTIQEHWQNGTTTYLGIAIDNFPNLFMAYGPHCPIIVNVVSCVEVQGSWVVRTIEYLRRRGITKFTPTKEATLTFKEHIDELYNASLFPMANFWDNRSDVPRTKKEGYFHHGGLALYKKEIMEEINCGYPNFQQEVL